MGKISQLPILDRPREKALKNGVESLSDYELLALILQSGCKNKSVLEVSMELIIKFNGLYNLFNSSIYELSKCEGIGKVKSLNIIVINELFKRFSLLRLVGKSVLTSNPIISESGQSEGYTCTYKLDDGCDGEEHFPTGFWLDVPFAKAGENTYGIPLELLFFRNDDDELRIEVLCPLFENIEETAIIDEADFVKEQTQNCERLLVLSDF